MADEETISFYEEQGEAPNSKKKRLQGACDACRKRKIKCDSSVRVGNICSYCESINVPCTHNTPRPPTKKEVQETYVHGLEDRLSKIEHILRGLHPGRDIETLLDLNPDELSQLNSPAKKTIPKSFLELKYPTPHLPSTLASEECGIESANQALEVDPVEEQQDLSHVDLVEHMNKLIIDDKRFFGRASAYMFAQYAMHAKMEASGTHTEYPLDSNMLRRPLYWGMRPWEMAHARSEEDIRFNYPEPDLLSCLVSLYFEKSNIIMPILHKPTFLRSLRSGQHFEDPSFGMTVLLVCAIGSRFTSDSRVLLDDDISDLSSGWKYFEQVPVFRKGLFVRCTLYDLQCYTLSILYLLGTSTAHVVWPLLGLGVRFAQEKGVHRRKGQTKRTVEDESQKLAFWCLICLDRWLSAFLGRPCAMQDEEFDLEYPVECDEEYWETSDPEKAFQQPPGKPCKMSCFIWLIKLAEMLGYAHRTLYATKKSKMLIGLIGNEWESRVVSELDSSMNKWKDDLPDFLRWNPENPDPVFFCQSVALYTSFYHLQIQVHRPFLMKRSALSRSSFAMCTSAARSTAHVLEAATSRGASLFASSHMSGFAAALVLLLSQWAHQQTDPTVNSKTIMDLVRKLFVSLKEGEQRWHMAGRFVDLVEILCSLSDNPSSPQPKRQRDPTAIIDPPPQPQSHQDYRGALWEQPSFAGGPLQKQIAASKLELPLHMQMPEYGAPASHWDISSFAMPQMGSHEQSFSMAGPVDVTPQPAAGPFAAGVADHPPLFGTLADGLTPYLLDPHLQGYVPAEDPASSIGLDVPDDLFTMWENAPVGFSSYDWEIFLSMQPPSGP